MKNWSDDEVDAVVHATDNLITLIVSFLVVFVGMFCVLGSIFLVAPAGWLISILVMISGAMNVGFGYLMVKSQL